MEFLKNFLIQVILILLIAIVAIVGWRLIEKRAKEAAIIESAASEKTLSEQIKHNTQKTGETNKTDESNEIKAEEQNANIPAQQQTQAPQDAAPLLAEVTESSDEISAEEELENDLDDTTVEDSFDDSTEPEPEIDTNAESPFDDTVTAERKRDAQNLLTDLDKIKQKPNFRSFVRWENKLEKLVSKSPDREWETIYSLILSLGMDYLMAEWRETADTFAKQQTLADILTIRQEEKTLPPKLDYEKMHSQVRTIPVMQVYFNEVYELVRTNIETKLLFPQTVKFPPFAVYDHISRTDDDFSVKSFFVAQGPERTEYVEYEASVHKYYHGYAISNIGFSDTSVFSTIPGPTAPPSGDK